MDLKRLQGFDSLIPAQPSTTGGVQKPTGGAKPADGEVSFKDTFEQALKQQVNGQATTAGVGSGLKGPNANLNADALKFSNHAVERMQSRGIRFSPEDMTRLNDAVSRAAAKGSKDSLILMKDSALIVSVKNKTVVTVMDKTALKENVFTNIDSTIVM